MEWTCGNNLIFHHHHLTVWNRVYKMQNIEYIKRKTIFYYLVGVPTNFCYIYLLLHVILNKLMLLSSENY
jgi:hypothetical protein